MVYSVMYYIESTRAFFSF